jgi:hypothetical protein
MPFLNNPFAIIATLSLTIQIVVLFLLIYGYWLNKELKFPRHGIIMEIAVILHLTMIFAIMIPGFIFGIIPTFISSHILGLTSVVTLIHVVSGATAVSLGVWFVLAWRIHGLRGCFNRKKLMISAMVVWLISIFLGTLLFSILYWSVLMG